MAGEAALFLDGLDEVADRAQRAQWAEEIRTGSGAEVVHSIGQVVAFYRRNRDKPVIELPV